MHVYFQISSNIYKKYHTLAINRNKYIFISYLEILLYYL